MSASSSLYKSPSEKGLYQTRMVTETYSHASLCPASGHVGLSEKRRSTSRNSRATPTIMQPQENG